MFLFLSFPVHVDFLKHFDAQTKHTLGAVVVYSLRFRTSSNFETFAFLMDYQQYHRLEYSHQVPYPVLKDRNCYSSDVSDVFLQSIFKT